jgi:excisionase family DNA binding protein
LRHKIVATEDSILSEESLDAEQQGAIESEATIASVVSDECKEEKKYYTVDEIQRILSLSKRDSYSLVQSDAFAVVKVGKRYLIPQKSFDEWLNANTTREE